MPVQLSSESGRNLRNASRPVGSGGGGGGSGSSSLSGMAGGGSNSGTVYRILGPPDVYPQDPGQVSPHFNTVIISPITYFIILQKEDELTAVHVKQGFTQSYSSMVSEEYASAASKAASVSVAKVLQELKNIQVS